VEIIVAANIDQVIITSSIFQPDIRFGLIDRYLCAVEIAGIKPVICVNKIDLIDSMLPFQDMLNFYENCGYQVILTSVANGKGLAELREALKDKDSVFSGHSGAGKSSILNALQPSLQRKTSEISEHTQKGVHTTTNSCLVKWDFGGYLVDTPGIKTFGLNSNHKDLLPRIFPGFDNYWEHCKFSDCTHTHEINCAVKNAVEKDEIPWDRYDSYARILESL
jgi:ribosome biogenesis GTPase